MSSVAETGVFRFDSTGDGIGGGTSLADLKAMRIGKMMQWRVAGGETIGRVSGEGVEGLKCDVTVHFTAEGKVRGMELFPAMPADRTARGWEDWSKEGEKGRRALGEAWMERVLAPPTQSVGTQEGELRPRRGEGCAAPRGGADGRKGTEGEEPQTRESILTLKPFVTEDGREIEPGLPDEDHPTWVRCAWGSVTAAYDSKGGMSFLWVEWRS